MKKSVGRLLGAGGVLAIGLALAAGLASRFLPHGWTWTMLTWRAELFARKAEGHIPQLSWRELWFMSRAHGGFGMEQIFTDGFSPEGAVSNPFTTSSDYKKGSALFLHHCVVCHGRTGAGGFGPPLNRLGYMHGDSDLAVYKVVRDGIPGTAMPEIPLGIEQRWDLVGFLRTLQLASQEGQTDAPHLAIQVTAADIQAGSKPDQWLTYSGTLDGHRFTPLAEITSSNAAKLHLRWVHQFDTAELDRSEATPLVANGTIFMTEPPANVVALESSTGRLLWEYRHTLPDKLPICCSRANRGLAILNGVLYFASLDGYLIALDAATGQVLWKTEVCSPSKGFTMTGAPLIVNDSVVVGVAGGEFAIRGFLASYDAKNGKQRWKFETVPGPGEFGHETWSGESWKSGGGPTWVTGSYDPTLDLVYWGVGNPVPNFLGDVRPGDNLFTDSVIALHGKTGKLAWYFQFTPHDEHDWDAAQTPVLADIPINGVLRHLLLTANRNGFYYVLDRTDGQFLTGVPFVTEDWASGLDAKGHPILTPNNEPTTTGRLIHPGVAGGINWQNIAFDPKSRTVFVPATEGASVFTKSQDAKQGQDGFFPGSSGGANEHPSPVILALDALTGRKKWELSLPSWQPSQAFGYSGLLATGGNLVFGASGGDLFVIDSATGHELWRVFLGGDTYAAPISFTVNGHQVLAVSAGRALYLFGL